MSPACAGMIPSKYGICAAKRCEPRMRGDDPLIDSHISITDEYMDYNRLSTIFH